ncbi:MAG: phosphate acyltransferase [Desulfomonilia bacterium]
MQQIDMIKSFSDIDAIAEGTRPLRLAAMAADEKEFLLTVKIAAEKGYVLPRIIGEREKILRAAQDIAFDLSGVEISEVKDPQTIADTGIGLLFGGQVDIAMKGHIPTAFVYRSIIRNERKIGGKKTISVNTLWDVPDSEHLITITDTGVSIAPGYETKRTILADAVNLMRLLGYELPKVLVLSATGIREGRDGLSGDRSSLKADAEHGDFGPCEVLEATSLWDLSLPRESLAPAMKDASPVPAPHVFLVPHLDAGNILSKLDFILDVIRRSLVMTSRGPVIIPSRSDTHQTIVGEIALGVVVAQRLQEASP